MTDYISEFEHFRMLYSDIMRFNELVWSDVCPITEDIPDNAGVFVLTDKDSNFLTISASNNMNRRLDELLKDKKGRYDNAAFFQYFLEENNESRFHDRTYFKHLIKRIETPVEEFSNVLPNDHPKIIEQNERLKRSIQEQVNK